MAKIPNNMSFRICVYPSGDDRYPNAEHCLDLDVIGTGKSVQAALDQLMELIELQIEISADRDIAIEFAASPEVGEQYLAAQKDGHRVTWSDRRQLVLPNVVSSFAHERAFL